MVGANVSSRLRGEPAFGHPLSLSAHHALLELGQDSAVGKKSHLSPDKGYHRLCTGFQRLEAFNRVWKRQPPNGVSLAYITALLKAFMGVKDEAPALPDNSAPPAFTQIPDFED